MRGVAGLIGSQEFESDLLSIDSASFGILFGCKAGRRILFGRIRLHCTRANRQLAPHDFVQSNARVKSPSLKMKSLQNQSNDSGLFEMVP